MDLIQAVILGLMQGITEWLPVSSQGNVIIAGIKLFGLEAEQAFNYSVFLHIGTVLAAIIYFRKDIKKIIELKEKKLLNFIFIAVLSTAITAVPVYLLMKQIAVNSMYLTLLIGLMLILTGFLQWKKKIQKKTEENSKNAFFLGLGQGFSVLPGVSRSGITTSVLLFEGFTPEKAFKLSFLLSIPSVLIAELGFGIMEGIEFEMNLLISILIAFVVGYFSIKYLIEFSKKINFSWFCFAIGIFYIIISFL